MEKRPSRRLTKFTGSKGLMGKVSTLGVFVAAAIAVAGCKTTTAPLQKNELGKLDYIYGNFCGSKHPNVTEMPEAQRVAFLAAGEPVDDIDMLCKTHDLCIIGGYKTERECDEAMLAGFERHSFDAGGQLLGKCNNIMRDIAAAFIAKPYGSGSAVGNVSHIAGRLQQRASTLNLEGSPEAAGLQVLSELALGIGRRTAFGYPKTEQGEICNFEGTFACASEFAQCAVEQEGLDRRYAFELIATPPGFAGTLEDLISGAILTTGTEEATPSETSTQ